MSINNPQYQVYIRRFADYLMSHQLRLGLSSVQAYCQTVLSNPDTADMTKAMVLNVVKVYCKHHKSTIGADEYPQIVQYIKQVMPRDKIRTNRDAVTEEELRLLGSSSMYNGKVAALTNLVVSTGLKSSQLIQLRRDRLLFNGKTYEAQIGRSFRIKLSKRLVNQITQAFPEQDTYLISSKKGGHLGRKSVARILHNAGQDLCGRPISVEMLRDIYLERLSKREEKTLLTTKRLHANSLIRRRDRLERLRRKQRSQATDV